MFHRNVPALLLCLSLSFFSCQEYVTGNGNIITDERTVDRFNRIDLLGAANAEIIQGSEFRVSIKSYENIVPLVKTTVSDGKLTVSTIKNINLANTTAEVQITCPTLQEVTLSGAGNMVISSFHQTNMKVSLNGAGNAKFSDSECDTVYATLSGAGNMHVKAKSYLEATLNGVGNIEYAGDPVVQSKISGVGNVTKK